jgi:hypothetical protein
MGLMTNITILNDSIEDIEKDLKGWWENKVKIPMSSTEIRENMISNDTTVNSVEHSSVTTILAVGGNHTTVLGYSSLNENHADPEVQIKLLKELASTLGYKVIKNG